MGRTTSSRDGGNRDRDRLGRYFELDQEEMYGEVFEIPEPDELIFLSWFAGGEVFRSGCCYTRGRGRILSPICRRFSPAAFQVDTR